MRCSGNFLQRKIRQSAKNRCALFLHSGNFCLTLGRVQKIACALFLHFGNFCLALGRVQKIACALFCTPEIFVSRYIEIF